MAPLEETDLWSDAVQVATSGRVSHQPDRSDPSASMVLRLNLRSIFHSQRLPLQPPGSGRGAEMKVNEIGTNYATFSNFNVILWK